MFRCAHLCTAADLVQTYGRRPAVDRPGLGGYNALLLARYCRGRCDKMKGGCLLTTAILMICALGRGRLASFIYIVRVARSATRWDRNPTIQSKTWVASKL